MHPADLRRQIDGTQQFVDGLRSHPGIELVAVLLECLQVLLVGEQLPALQGLDQTRIHDHEGLEVEDALDITQGHVQQQTDPRGQGLEEPDVGHGAGEIDMSHALAAYFRQRDLHAAFFAHDATVFEPLVLSAQALVIIDGTEDLGAEQPVTLGLEGPIIDGLGLLDLAERPGADHVRGGQTDLDGIELQGLTLLLQNLEKVFQFRSSGMDGPRLWMVRG